MFELVTVSIFLIASSLCGMRAYVLSHEPERDVEQKTDEQGRNSETYQDPTSGSRPASAPSDCMKGERDSQLR